MRVMSLDLHLLFHMKDGETREDAEDRMIEALEVLDPDFVASWKVLEIEEVEDDEST